MTRRRPAQTDETLAHIFAQTLKPSLLLVVNVEADAETERVVAAWSQRHPEVIYRPIAENVGPAGAVAAGIPDLLVRAPDAAYIGLFEDDEPPTDACAVARLVAHLDGQPASSRVGGAGYHGAQLNWTLARLRRPMVPAGGVADVDYLAGGSLPVFHRELFEHVGGYDPEFFFGFEELEFGLRARDAGWRLHLLGRSNSSADGASAAAFRPGAWPEGWSWRRYYSLRNLLVILLRRHRWFAAAHVAVLRGIGRPLLLLPRHPAAAVRHLRNNTAAIRDAVSGRLGPTLRTDGSPRTE